MRRAQASRSHKNGPRSREMLLLNVRLRSCVWESNRAHLSTFVSIFHGHESTQVSTITFDEHLHDCTLQALQSNSPRTHMRSPRRGIYTVSIEMCVVVEQPPTVVVQRECRWDSPSLTRITTKVPTVTPTRLAGTVTSNKAV